MEQIKVPDDDLMRRIAEGDKEAFEALYLMAREPVYCLALSIVRSPDRADDIAQETFIKVHQTIAGYTPQNKPMAWIFTIAKHLAYRETKKISEMQELPENETAPDRIEDTLDSLVLEKAMKILSEEEREIVLLHAVSGYKFREIAGFLSMPLGSALAKYNRSLKKLRRAMEQEER